MNLSKNEIEIHTKHVIKATNGPSRLPTAHSQLPKPMPMVITIPAIGLSAKHTCNINWHLLIWNCHSPFLARSCEGQMNDEPACATPLRMASATLATIHGEASGFDLKKSRPTRNSPITWDQWKSDRPFSTCVKQGSCFGVCLFQEKSLPHLQLSILHDILCVLSASPGLAWIL